MPAEPPPVSRPGALERVLQLRAFSAFESVAPPHLAVLAELAEERRFPAGTRLQEEGMPAREIHYLLDGEVEIRRRGVAERRLGPLSVVNGLASLAQVRLSREVVAITDTTALSFTHEDQVDVFDDNFEILASVLRGVAGAFLDALATAGPAALRLPPPAVPASPVHALGLVEKIAALRAAPPYDEAPLEALAELARESPQVRFAAGERLWSAGDESGWSLAIVAGSVTSAGVGAEVRVIAGSIAGVLESMAGRPREFDAVAETDVVGLRIETGTLLDTLEDHTDMALGLLHSMARDVLALRERIAAAGSSDPQPG